MTNSAQWGRVGENSMNPSIIDDAVLEEPRLHRRLLNIVTIKSRVDFELAEGEGGQTCQVFFLQTIAP